jgi:hypothetical protein
MINCALLTDADSGTNGKYLASGQLPLDLLSVILELSAQLCNHQSRFSAMG